MNSTYHSAIKAIFYKVVFNQKPNYKWVDKGRWPKITEVNVKEHIIEDKQDDKLIEAKQHQLVAETRFWDKLQIPEVDMTATTLSSWLISLGLDETLSEYVKSLLGNSINFESIT